MANIFEFKGYKPVIDESSFVHPNATVLGNVIIGRDVYIGPGAAIRGDWGKIIIEDGSNVQENCVIHMFPGVTVKLHKAAHVGHGAIIHGAELGENCLIGMNSVLMDNVKIGKECIIGAMSFVKDGTEFPDRTLAVGNPAKAVKTVSDEMIKWKSEGTKLYQKLPQEMQETLKACKPLREEEADRPEMPKNYFTWKK
jgi:phenylacetic acid degradation protein/carnitine operon protein CaiE